MKLLFVFASFLILNSVFCANDGVLDAPHCEDYLPLDTCTKLINLATLLHEKASIVSDAVREAVLKHQTKAEDMLAYIKEYIAERFDCNVVLTPDLCKKIFDLGSRVKLTSSEVRMAIENAVNNGAKTAEDIYNKSVNFMTSKITCAKIFSEITCNNLKLVIQKFHEQKELLNEAIISAAQKQINDVKDLLESVKNIIIERAVNFKCEDVAPALICNQIRDIALKLHLKAFQIQKAIQLAVLDGAVTATDIFQKTIYFFTDMLNCDLIIGKTACENLYSIVNKLHEQRRLINEAIIEAVVKQINSVQDIIIYVKNRIVETATSFQCTDVLTQQQCGFLSNLASKFKLRSGEVRRVLIETIVNGTSSAIQIYRVTVGQLVKDANSIQCEDLLPKSICDQLSAFAEKFRVRKEEVSIIVRTVIAGGAVTVADIYSKSKEYLIELISCETFLGETICSTIEALANRLHISFKKVIQKLREYVANGITTASELRSKIIAYIWSLFFGTDSKRSLDASTMTDKIIEMVEKLVTIGKDVKERLKLDITRAIQQGKVTLQRLKEYVKELVAKYGPQSDDVTTVHKSVIDQLKEALKNAHGKARVVIELLLTKSKEELQKLKELIKSVLGNQDSSDALEITHNMFADEIRQQLDEELEHAENEIEKMVFEELYW